jgi:hypothetical protein
MHGKKFDAAFVVLPPVGAAEHPASTSALTPRAARPANAVLREVNVTVSSKITPGTLPSELAPRYSE